METKKELYVTPNNQLSVMNAWSVAFDELINTQKISLTQEEKAFGVSILANLSKRCLDEKIDVSLLQITDFLEQVKHYAKLKLSIAEGEIYLDIRNVYEPRPKTDTSPKKLLYKLVKISRTYQGMQKLLMTYCSKDIVRFKDGIVVDGDTFEAVDDFDTGITKIKHIKNLAANRTNYNAIKYAYAIAYVNELGTIVPYTCLIPKQRIDRAKNASKTDLVWKSDMDRMVTKTAYWCLWSMLKPFITFPSSVGESLSATEDEMDWEYTEDTHDGSIGNEENVALQPQFSSEMLIPANTEDAPVPMQQPSGIPQQVETVKITSTPVQQPQTTAIPAGAERIPYGVYLENKDKYTTVPNTYDKTNRTILVIPKQ